MEINIVELIVQAGALGLTALLMVGLWKYGGAFVSRLMDNLDLQAKNHESDIELRAELTQSLSGVARTLATLCVQMDNCEEQHQQRSSDNMETQGEIVAALDTLATRMANHEQQAKERHSVQMEQAQKQHELQMRQARERHNELITALRGLNGK